MRFYYKDCSIINFDYMKYNSNYEIDRQLFYDSIEEAEKDADRIYKLLKYKVENGNKNNKEKYKNITFLIGISRTDGKTAEKVKRTTKGRPKYEIIGKPKKPHLHIVVYGENVSSFCNEILEKLNNHNNIEMMKKLKNKFKYETNTETKKLLLFKKEKLKPSIHDEHDIGLYLIPYIWKQSEKIYMYGNLKEELKKTYCFYQYFIFKK